MTLTTTERVQFEVQRARALFPPIHSLHEAIAVIREEYLEAEREVFVKHPDQGKLYKELIQLAAMCVRAIEDLHLEASPLDGLVEKMQAQQEMPHA